MKHLLIISNNVLSKTNNNGKTILSFIDGLQDTAVSQLYLSGETPRVQGYEYFRISDKDIIRGLIRPAKRGQKMMPDTSSSQPDDFTIRRKFGRNNLTLLLRDLLWHGKWKSGALISWLDEIHPDAVFFVAGDAMFPYEICNFIQNRYSSRLTVYMTDDYIMPRSGETAGGRFRRKLIRHQLKKTLKEASCFYTISESMREAYLQELNADSYLAVNMSEDLLDPGCRKKENEIILTYAGSFYYHRSEVLARLARTVRHYNEKHADQPARLLMYSNQEPGEEIRRQICLEDTGEYGGSLNPEQLKERLNTSDVLVFVESFDPEETEKVRYSLSTKIPEYMSTGKAILAIGPAGIGSMRYLEDAALCVTDLDRMDEQVTAFLEDPERRKSTGEKSRSKYLMNHNREKLQKAFAANVLGNDVIG